MKAFRYLGVMLVLGLVFANQGNAITIKQILEKFDQHMEIDSDMSAAVKITQTKPGQGNKEIQALYYRRDSDDSFLIVMTSPENEAGNGYLRVGDNFWMYKRNSRTFQFINRDESISGTDVKGGDFEKRKMVEMYAGVKDADGKEKLSEEKMGKAQIPVYKLEIESIVNDVTYPKQIYWVRQDNYLPLKVESYSLNGDLMQTDYYLQYMPIGNKFFMVKGMFVDEFNKGNKSLMEISSISLKKISDQVFTKAYLENLSK